MTTILIKAFVWNYSSHLLSLCTRLKTNFWNSPSLGQPDGAFNVICEIFCSQKSKAVFVTLCKNILRILNFAGKYQVRRQPFTKPNIGPIWLKDWKMDNGPGPAFCPPPPSPLAPSRSQKPPLCPWSQILRAVARNVTVCEANIITFILGNILCCPEIRCGPELAHLFKYVWYKCPVQIY